MKVTDKQIQELVESSIIFHDRISEYKSVSPSKDTMRLLEAIKPFLPVKPIIAQYYREGEYRTFIELTDEVKAALEKARINYQTDSD